ncbi:MAG: UDP-N-acetylmuramoyl-tripeptide--D-alanyl-D-alanine ligase [Chthoniobacteraceae bacterium]|nr:UDP-N-acetylmuramoyl-tripeptide--D-alanyl-D-alanine ligase [Chthoniobacteraceae bacterium]
MDPTSLQQLAQWAHASLSCADAARTVTRVCTDTRGLEAGDLFVALRGEHFDGHHFVSAAAAAGAAAALVDTAFEGETPAGFALLRVEDTLRALQEIAASYRASLPLRVLALTGSTGKTSTKDFTAAVLSERFRVVKTEGNFNNHIGLPLTMLRASAADEIGIFEIGMNHPGEIAPLAALAAPDAAIITNIGSAHIEFLGSRAGIAQEKGLLAEALPASGFLVLNDRDEFSDAIAARTRAGVVRSGIGRGELSATLLASGMDGSRFRVRAGEEEAEVILPVPGLHMIENALLALAAGRAFGVSLADGARGLSSSRLTHGRLERKTLGGIHFLDDSYNANPDSMRAALRTLAVLPVTGARIAVLGRMGELGRESETGHRSVGRDAADAGVDLLIAVGGAEAGQLAEAARQGGLKNVHHVADPAAAAALLAENAHPGDLVLLKGSRAARMERVLEHPAFLSPSAAS